ncbi:hypothetical protein RB195_017727 [Necator americanus]|uniref:Uncharacterized protein n=1 Tax=Necator americanus TaxID=51031 RepID=A0ABR1C6H5_NECAM
MHRSYLCQEEAKSCALFIGSFRLRNVSVRFMDSYEGRRCVLFFSEDDGVVESLVIPFSHILKIIYSHHVKDYETHSHGISIDLDPTASMKLALVYAEALNDEQRKIIFYDLTRFDEPKMTVTMLFAIDYMECSCYKILQKWVRRGNEECVTRDSRNGLVTLEEFPHVMWCSYLVGIGVITSKAYSRKLSAVYDSLLETRRKKSDSYVAPMGYVIAKEVPCYRFSRSKHLYQDVFGVHYILKNDLDTDEKIIIDDGDMRYVKEEALNDSGTGEVASREVGVNRIREEAADYIENIIKIEPIE